MSAPHLVPLRDAVHAHVPLALGPGEQAFVVERAGWFGGRAFGEGAVIVCGPPPPLLGEVVLVCDGPGRPRLGCIEGTRLYGDRGEPRSAARWRAVGQIRRVVGAPARRSAAASLAEREAARQLALFAA